METEILEDLGLSKREISVYLALLKEKISTPNKLSKLSNINRTTVYLDLEKLIQKGLATSFMKNAKKNFQATNPNKLAEIVEEKRKRVEKIIPTLESLYSPRTDLNVELFEGKQGIKKIYEDILKEKQEVLGIGVTGKSFDVLKYYYPHILKKALKSNITERCLANFSAKKYMEKHPSKIVKVKYLPKGKDADVTTLIYSNKIVHLSLKEDKIYAVLITEEFLNKSYRNHFEMLWSMF
ncbi:MAG: TrmB family transcriptional regulator [Candidatus Woesearchaeota archaeon]